MFFGNVFVRTAPRRINELSFKSYKPQKKPMLTRAQRLRRVRFAKKYIDWGEENLKSVLWSDEATFTVTENR